MGDSLNVGRLFRVPGSHWLPYTEGGEKQELWSGAVIGTTDSILVFAPT